MKSGARSDLVTQREIEHKFSVAALFVLPDISLGGTFAVTTEAPITQTALYFDTSDLKLFRWGITLRRRDGGKDAGWHLKLPVESGGGARHVRDELQLPLSAGTSASVPETFTRLLPGFLRGTTLHHVVTLRTVRQAHVICDAAGVELAELVDDTVSVLNGRNVAARFREVEVEEISHSVDLSILIGQLRAAGAVPSSISKAATALGPSSVADADVPRPRPVTAESTAADVVNSYLSTHVRALLFADLDVRRDAPDSVHQLRVAVRRLRSALRTFGPLLEPEFTSGLRRELGWLANELGASRDTEVMLHRLNSHAKVLAPEHAKRVREAVATELPPQLERARIQALAALDSSRHLALIELLIAAASAPALTPDAAEPARTLLPALVAEAWDRLADDVKKLRYESPSDDWHEARILAKRARYAAEALPIAFGQSSVDRAVALAHVTETLGEHQDAWLAQQTLQQLAAKPDTSGLAGFSLGLLCAHELDCEYRARALFTERWPEVRRAHRQPAKG